jgi:hypothetical protein
VPGGGKVTKQKVVEIGAAKAAASINRLWKPDLIRALPALPVLPETLLQLELEVGERPVELARISNLILSDPGAAIQTTRLASHEWDSDSSPRRIEDSISGLGVHACLDALSKHVITRCGRNQAAVAMWEHAIAIGHISKHLAEEYVMVAIPENARWVGLCHEISSFPEVFGWNLVGRNSTDLNLVGLSLAEAWSLPQCVAEYFCDRLMANHDSPWTAIVDEAHNRIQRKTALRSEDNDFPKHIDVLTTLQAV